MKNVALCLISLLCAILPVSATRIEKQLPVRGFAIQSPSPGNVDLFVRFINEELAPARINLLVLRIDWNYEYQSHPELRDEETLSRAQVEKIVAACKAKGIRLVPHINLLGHQSWKKNTYPLLRAYPQFDETPSIKAEYYSNWPNRYGLYCKSYCPLHPDLHKVLFEVIDELCDVFQSDAFHAGMDEVFYIGMDECPRCHGKDKAKLFAGEVKTIRDHLAAKGRQTMIWGDRLLDGRTTGLGEWEASENDTWRAIDLIPKDVLVFDWHYERAELTPVYFAVKGQPVVSCGYRDPEISLQQVKDMIKFREQSTREMKECLQGYVHTIWTSADEFLRIYYNRSWKDTFHKKADGSVEATKAVLLFFRKNDQ